MKVNKQGGRLMDQETCNRQKTASVDYLAGNLIADIIIARILADPDSQFNIDAYWSDLREDVLYECEQRMKTVHFMTNKEEWG